MVKKKNNIMCEYVESLIDAAQPWVDKGLSSTEILQGFHFAAISFAETLLEMAREELKEAHKKR